MHRWKIYACIENWKPHARTTHTWQQLFVFVLFHTPTCTKSQSLSLDGHGNKFERTHPWWKRYLQKFLIHADCFGLTEGTETVIYIPKHMLHIHTCTYSTYKYRINILSSFLHTRLLFPPPQVPFSIDFSLNSENQWYRKSGFCCQRDAKNSSCCACLHTAGRNLQSLLENHGFSILDYIVLINMIKGLGWDFCL